MDTQQILVIEAVRSGKEGITKLLKLIDLQADTVDNAERALELLRSKHYSLCVIDLTLPTIEGWKLLRSLRYSREFIHFPCIAITTHRDGGNQQKMLQAGFTTFMPTQPLTSLVQQIKEVAYKISLVYGEQVG